MPPTTDISQYGSAATGYNFSGDAAGQAAKTSYNNSLNYANSADASGARQAPLTSQTTPINSNSLVKTDPIALPTVPNSTSIASTGAIGAAAAGNQVIQDKQQAAVDAAQAKVNNDQIGYQDIYNKISGIGTATLAAEQAAGAPQLQQTAASLTNEYQTKQLAYNAQNQAISQDAGLSVDQRARQLAAVNNDHSYAMTDLAIRQNIASSNYQAVEQLVQHKIDLQYGSLKDLIGYQTNILNSDKSILSDKQKSQLQVQLDQNKNQYDEAVYQAHALQTAKTDLIKTATSWNAPPDVLANIQAGKDLASASAAGGKYVEASKFSPVNLGYDKNGNPRYGAFNIRTGQFVGGSSSEGNGGSPTASVSTSAATNVSTTLNVSTSTSASSIDPATFFKALTQNEGGSPNGVQNNPGNIKYMGQAGATNSGVKATDGGTFASFATPEDGIAAGAALVKKLASENGATVGSVTAKWTNTTNPDDVQKPTFAQYGKLANTDFDPTKYSDKTAFKYLQSYLGSGTIPSARAMGISTSAGGGALFTTASQRANDLYFKATGQPLPNPEQIKTNLALVASNNKLANNLDIQSQTVKGNIDLSLNNMNKNGLNSSGFKPLDSFIDNVKNIFQDPAVGQYLSQNTTIANEVGSLLAVKNSSGTTVYDKLESAHIIDRKDSPEVIKQKINTMLQEAGIFSSALNSQNKNLYSIIDPLQINPQNPNRNDTINSQPVLSNGVDLTKFNK